MQYFGGKTRIAKDLSSFLNSQLKPSQPFVDLFCGSCNIISKIDGNRIRIANDKHQYLIAMWKELQIGWLPPKELSRDEYDYIKNHKDETPHLTGFVGFGCSFAGKWFGGYAQNKRNDNFCLQSYNSTLKKTKFLNSVEFYCNNYDEVEIPIGSLVYCDIPYKGSTQYSKNEVGIFDHDEFYKWVLNNSDKYDIYISEYLENLPVGFEIVWSKSSNKEIRNVENERKKTVEILMKKSSSLQ